MVHVPKARRVLSLFQPSTASSRAVTMPTTEHCCVNFRKSYRPSLQLNGTRQPRHCLRLLSSCFPRQKLRTRGREFLSLRHRWFGCLARCGGPSSCTSAGAGA